MVARLPSAGRQLRLSSAGQRRGKVLDTTSFDLVFAHCSSVAPYVEHVEGVPKMLDFGDMDSQKWLMYGDVRAAPVAWGFRLEGVKLQREERRLADRFDLCSCTTRAELETLRSYGSATDTGWFPNGVDFDYFRPSSEGYDSDLVSFIGRMDYYPNQQGVQWFCHEVLPLLRRERPSLRFAVVGAAPPPAIERLGSLPGSPSRGSV
jgi:glycosyltransferase involved in cell wall biosynthesis